MNNLKAKENLRVILNYNKSTMNNLSWCHLNNATINFFKDENGNNCLKMNADGIPELKGSDFHSIMNQIALVQLKNNFVKK